MKSIGPRLLADGLEVVDVVPVVPNLGFDDLLNLAGSSRTRRAGHFPSGATFFPTQGHARARAGEFTGLWASATIGSDRYILGPPEDDPSLPDWFETEHRGGYLLSLYRETDEKTLGYIALRRRLRDGIDRLVETCQRLGVVLELLPTGAPVAAQVVAERTGLTVARTAKTLDAIRAYQRTGAAVLLVSDHAGAEAGFAACDLAVGILSRYTGEFPARADLLAPDLRALADLIDTGARRQQVVDNAVLLSVAANALGGVFSLFQGQLGVERATYGIHVAALAAMSNGWLRLRGGHRPRSTLAFLADPRPEKWGRASVGEVLRAFTTTAQGLSHAEAAARRAPPVPAGVGDAFLGALFNQLRAPITCVLAGGGCLTLVLGQPLNTAIIALTISLNVAAGIWQEREIGMAAEALSLMGAGSGRVLRDSENLTVPIADVVPGDILTLAPGDRVAADARLLDCAGLEVGEAALTGESLPVAKGPDANAESDRILLEGSDVIAGTGRAIVVAVGKNTRLGATTAALSADKGAVSPMGLRLGQILRVALPLSKQRGGGRRPRGMGLGQSRIDAVDHRRHHGAVGHPRRLAAAGGRGPGRRGTTAEQAQSAGAPHRRDRGAGPRGRGLHRQDRHADRGSPRGSRGGRRDRRGRGAGPHEPRAVPAIADCRSGLSASRRTVRVHASHRFRRNARGPRHLRA